MIVWFFNGIVTSIFILAFNAFASSSYELILIVALAACVPTIDGTTSIANVVIPLLSASDSNSVVLMLKEVELPETRSVKTPFNIEDAKCWGLISWLPCIVVILASSQLQVASNVFFSYVV